MRLVERGKKRACERLPFLRGEAPGTRGGQRTHWVGTAAIRVDSAHLVGRWRARARRERSGAASEASTGARGHERGRHGRGPRHKSRHATGHMAKKAQGLHPFGGRTNFLPRGPRGRICIVKVPPQICGLCSLVFAPVKQRSGPGAPPLTFYGGVGRRSQRRGDVGTEGRRRNPCAHALMRFAYRRHAAERSASSEQK